MLGVPWVALVLRAFGGFQLFGNFLVLFGFLGLFVFCLVSVETPCSALAFLLLFRLLILVAIVLA